MSPTEGYKQFIPPVSNVPIHPVAPAPAPLMAQPPQQPLQQQYQQHQAQLLQQQQQQAMMMGQPMMVAPNSQAMGIQAIPQQQQISPEMLAQQQMMLMQQQQMLIQQQQIQQPMMTQQPMMQPQMVPMSSVAPIIPTGTVLPQPAMMASVIPNTSAQVVPPSKPPLVDQLSSGSLLDSLNQVQPMMVATAGPLPAAPTPTPPQSGHASRSMSFSEKAPSVPDSP